MSCDGQPLCFCALSHCHEALGAQELPELFVAQSVYFILFPQVDAMPVYPDYLSPNVTPTKAQKSRARREPSGVFSLFQPAQIQQFKEAFQLIDHDKDGWVTEKDLNEIFTSLGTLACECLRAVLIKGKLPLWSCRHRTAQGDARQPPQRSTWWSQQVGLHRIHR
jgi:hypothetical protein